MRGSRQFILAHKLKGVTHELKMWDRRKFADLRVKVASDTARLHDLHTTASCNRSDQLVQVQIKETKSELKKSIRRLNSLIKKLKAGQTSLAKNGGGNFSHVL